ncbi:MAG: sigma-70 family RNA polymerase sigma factor [Actinomycetales bacterium]
MSTGTPEHHLRSSVDSSERSDAELLAATRTGDENAYAELFRRHSGAATALARRLTGHPSDADDLVSEAFTKVLAALRNGSGPTSALRPYLLTAVRRVHVDRAVAGKRVQPTDDMSVHDPGVPFVDPALAGLERSMVAQAYQQLPERWQMVLWHTEVEELSPKDIAPLLGMSPNAVAALALRARAGLREAYLAAHVTTTSSPECERMLPKLAAYVRGSASARERAAVERHLPDCEDCRGVLAELQDVGGRMRAVIAPLILGTAATGYLADVAALPAVAAPFSQTAAGAVSSAGGGSSGGSAGSGAQGGAGAGGGGAGAGAGATAATTALGGWLAGSAAAVIVVGAVVGAVVLAQNAPQRPAASQSASAEGEPGAGSHIDVSEPPTQSDDTLGPGNTPSRTGGTTSPNLASRTATVAQSRSSSTSPTSLPVSSVTTSVTTSPEPTRPPNSNPPVDTTTTTPSSTSTSTSSSTSSTTSPTTEPTPTTTPPPPPPPPPTAPPAVLSPVGELLGGYDTDLTFTISEFVPDMTVTITGWQAPLSLSDSQPLPDGCQRIDPENLQAGVECGPYSDALQLSLPVVLGEVDPTQGQVSVPLQVTVSAPDYTTFTSTTDVAVKSRPANGGLVGRYQTTGTVSANSGGGSWLVRGGGNNSAPSAASIQLPSTSIRHAELYWTGPIAGQNIEGPNRDQMRLTIPGASEWDVVPGEASYHLGAADTNWQSFVSRADVTALVQGYVGGLSPDPAIDEGASQTWTLNVTGAPDEQFRTTGQTAFTGWWLVIVAEDPDAAKSTRLSIYDGDVVLSASQPTYSVGLPGNATDIQLLGWGAGDGTDTLTFDDGTPIENAFDSPVGQVDVPVPLDATQVTVNAGSDTFAITTLIIVGRTGED